MVGRLGRDGGGVYVIVCSCVDGWMVICMAKTGLAAGSRRVLGMQIRGRLQVGDETENSKGRLLRAVPCTSSHSQQAWAPGMPLALGTRPGP